MLKRIAAIGAVIIIIFLLIDCSMQKVAERDEGYTQSNLWAYYLYTDRDIRGPHVHLNHIILSLPRRMVVNRRKVVLFTARTLL